MLTSVDQPNVAVRAGRRVTGLWRWLPAAAVAGAQIYGAVARPTAERFPDLQVYYGAVANIGHRSIYDFITANDAPFTYPPFAGALLWPISKVSFGYLGIAWTVVTVAAVVALSMVVASDLRPRLSPHLSAWATPGCAAVLFLSAPISSNLRFGQVSIFLVLLILIDLLTLRNSRYQGILVGIAAAVKLTPLIFIPLLWFSGKRRAALVATGTFVVAAAIAFALLPHDSVRFWTSYIWRVNRLGHISTGGNQSFNGALLRLGTDDRLRAAAMFGFAAIVGLVSIVRAVRFAKASQWFDAAMIAGAASCAISPVSWTHHLTWLVLAVFIRVSDSVRVQAAWSVMVLAVMVLPVTALSVGTLGASGTLLGDWRLYLAIVIACAIPRVRRAGAEVAPENQRARRNVDGELHLEPSP